MRNVAGPDLEQKREFSGHVMDFLNLKQVPGSGEEGLLVLLSLDSHLHKRAGGISESLRIDECHVSAKVAPRAEALQTLVHPGRRKPHGSAKLGQRARAIFLEEVQDLCVDRVHGKPLANPTRIIVFYRNICYGVIVLFAFMQRGPVP